MKVQKSHITIISVLFICCGTYFGYLQNLIQHYLISNQQNWLSEILEYWYPQLPILKNSIAPELLLQRANQFIYRFVFLTLLFLFINSKKEFLRTEFNRFQFSTKHISILTSIFYGYAVFTFIDWWKEIANIQRLEAFYTPIFPLSIINSTLFHTSFYYSVLAIGITCATLPLWLKNNLLQFTTAIISISCLLFMHATFCGFGKMDHGYASFFYVGMILPFYFLWKDNRVIRFAQLTVTLCYFMAGLEKVFLSGIHFIDPTHFKSLLYLHPTPLGNWLSNQPLFCFTIPLLTLLVQLGAPFIFFNKKFVLPWVIGVILFHWGAYFFMNVGGYHSPWVFALSVFIPLLLEKKETIGLSTTSIKKGE